MLAIVRFAASQHHRRSLLQAGVLTAVVLCATGAGAVDGRVEVRAYRQESGAGDTSYRTDSLWENYSLGERIALTRDLLFNADFFVRRENLDGQSPAGRANSETVTLVPSFGMNYRRGHWQAGLEGRGLRRDRSGDTIINRRDESIDGNFWTRGEYDSWELELRLREIATWRYEFANDRKIREHNQDLNLRYFASDRDQFRYQFGRSNQDAFSFASESTYLTHQLQYLGGHQYAAGRGRFDLDLRTSHFRQERTQFESQGRRLLRPILGGYSLDDTPEFQDPLENDPILEPRLYDQNRDVPTAVAVGDNAPAVRDWGGDYRNVLFDFGDPEEIWAAIIYLSDRVDFPALMRWDIYVSDDPEGRDWGSPLSPGAYTIIYDELGNDRQGWRIEFTTPITHRRIKFVNTKVGLTGDDLFVTEVEVYGEAESSTSTVERTLRHRLRGSTEYQLTPDLDVRYVTEINDRHFLEDGNRLLRQNHLIGADWRIGTWYLSGNTQYNRLDSRVGRDTRANSQSLALSSPLTDRLRRRLSYQRSEDRSFTNRHLTQSMTLDLLWKVAPDLEVNQKISYGLRDAEDIDGMANSWVTITDVRSRPRPSIDLRLRRADRWVDREAGSGFTTFNDTEANLVWNLRPHVSWTSQVIYQVRDESDWLMRNTLAWNMLRGGSVELRTYASDYQDTRSETLRRFAGATVGWKPRARLRLEAGAETGLIKERTDRNLPVNLNARGTWTF